MLKSWKLTMTKVVYNACFGGFSLSEEGEGFYRACHLARYGKPVTASFFNRNIPRIDPCLVAAVEVLGEAANGVFAALRIRELAPGTRYYIYEYAGNEVVITEDEHEWEVA